jgi:hypothetical protein
VRVAFAPFVREQRRSWRKRQVNKTGEAEPGITPPRGRARPNRQTSRLQAVFAQKRAGRKQVRRVVQRDRVPQQSRLAVFGKQRFVFVLHAA